MHDGIQPIESILAALDLRLIRNEVAEYMTHDTEQISVLRQLRWYFMTYLPSKRHGELQAFIMWRSGQPVGYGLISKRGYRYWISGGIMPEYRGIGLGRLLFSYLTDYTLKYLDATVWLDVRNDNKSAVALYKKLGFRRWMDYPDGVSVMSLQGGDK